LSINVIAKAKAKAKNGFMAKVRDQHQMAEKRSSYMKLTFNIYEFYACGKL